MAFGLPRRKGAFGLRLRLTFSYVVFFTVLIVGLGFVFRQALDSVLLSNTRLILEQELVAVKGFLRIERNHPVWVFDRDDPDEAFIVERLRRRSMLSDKDGNVLEDSDLYQALGEDSPEALRSIQRAREPIWRIRQTGAGEPYLVCSGVHLDRQGQVVLSIGRSLADDRRILRQFTLNYFAVAPLLILGAGLLGWVLAGRALRPLNAVAQAAQSLTSRNLSLRLQARGADDELDHLIQSFNSMMDRLESSFNQIRRFNADVSHELRTPLTAIRGQLEVALLSAQTADQFREAMTNAMVDVERLSQIVRAMLLLSQAEAGQVTLNKEPMDLSALTRAMLEQFEVPAEMAGLKLAGSIAPVCRIEADRLQLERLISNLLSNALKYTPAGGEIRVELVQEDASARLVVADTGRGIPAEHLPHIFDRFYRVPDGGSDPERGVGIGLSFVAWIARSHGGSVDVTSEVGRGSRFTVRLPVGNIEVASENPPALVS